MPKLASGLPLKVLFAALLLISGLGWSVAKLWTQSESEMDAALFHTVTREDLLVTVTERGTLESSENTEIKCKVRGQNVITSVIPSGSLVRTGDELLTLDTLVIEDAIAERSKYAHWSRSGADHWEANAKRAKLAIEEYENGRFISELMNMEKDLAIAESNLLTNRNLLDHAKSMAERGYVSELDVRESEFSVEQAKLSTEVLRTQIDVLKSFTRMQELERLRGDWRAAVAEYEAAAERAKMDGIRRDQAVEELEQCVVLATKSGMVIYPPTEVWKNTPDIEEGATVHKEQTLLLMPDLDQMQVRVGIHESIIERISKGLRSTIRLPERTLDATVNSVATVANPSGWWSGNVVKYDAVIKLPKTADLKPGMTAGVEIVLADYPDVLTVPVAAVVESGGNVYVWKQVDGKPKRHAIRVIDSNEIYLAVDGGLTEGESVVLNPTAFIAEAKEMTNRDENDTATNESESRPPEDSPDETANMTNGRGKNA